MHDIVPRDLPWIHLDYCPSDREGEEKIQVSELDYRFLARFAVTSILLLEFFIKMGAVNVTLSFQLIASLPTQPFCRDKIVL